MSLIERPFLPAPEIDADSAANRLKNQT